MFSIMGLNCCCEKAKELEKLKAELDKLNSKNEQLRYSLSNTGDAANNYEKLLDEKNKEISKLKYKLENEKSDFNSLKRKEIEKWEKEINDLKDKNKHLGCSLLNTANSRDESVRLLEKTQKEKNEFKKEIEEKQKRFENSEKLAEDNKDLIKTREILKYEIKDLNEKNNKLQEKLDLYKIENIDIHTRLDNIRNSYWRMNYFMKEIENNIQNNYVR